MRLRIGTMQFGSYFMFHFWQHGKELRPHAQVLAFLRPAFLAIAGALVLLVGFGLLPGNPRADVPQGDEEGAKRYYRSLSRTLDFSSPEAISETTLDDVASYLGYRGLTGADLQNLPPDVLMNPSRLLAPCSPAGPSGCLQNRDALLATLGTTATQPDDILALRFFAPKIMNIKEPEATRKLGWRKLVRLRARPGSAAQAHDIASGIILFNIFTEPDAQPFSPSDKSVNTQVMLVTELSKVPKPNEDGPSTIYWLDYGTDGKLSLALDASFDANEVQDRNGQRPYFVPDGCNGCHGNNSTRAMVNYLDTDHWYDRLENDFPKVKKRDLPLVFDAQTNDTSSPAYRSAFDVIRRFNKEADEQVRVAQPRHDEALASQKWLELHATNDGYFPPLARASGPAPRWCAGDAAVLSALDQYCFRCHGTVKFSVFNRQAVQERREEIKERLDKNAIPGYRMPPDRPLPDDIRAILLNCFP